MTSCLVWLFATLGILFFSACEREEPHCVDRLNDKAYAYHYRNIDSTEAYAREALRLAKHYDAGRAEALNHLAFVRIIRMDYGGAYELLDSLDNETDSELELFVADVQRMRLCQRESKNKDFYTYRERAQRRHARIMEEDDGLDIRARRRLLYGETEMAIVASTYYYYVGLEGPSVEALGRINPYELMEADTALYLAYLYNVGAGGIVNAESEEAVNQEEFDHLMRCYKLSVGHGYPFWEANSMQGLSEHLAVPTYGERLMKDNERAVRLLNKDQMADSLLAGNLAERSVVLFSDFGDVYQTAGSYRTLAQCYWQIGDNASALICLEQAIGGDSVVQRAPDLVASIHEQLSVVYASMNDKSESDYYRNLYLDKQEDTRQDRYFESRAEQLDQSVRQLNLMLGGLLIVIVVVVVLLVVFNHLRRRANEAYAIDDLLAPLRRWEEINRLHVNHLREKREEIEEQRGAGLLLLEKNKRQLLEQRAKVSLVNGVMPLIDRMLHEINRLSASSGESSGRRAERYAYIGELTDKINDYNEVLTQWIEMRQGELRIHVESFSLQPLFDMVARSRMGFQLKGIDLEVNETAAVVKADRTLTLFMVNTIADNARKFTPAGGKVTVGSREADEYVEIFVQDTGCGMTETQRANLFSKAMTREMRLQQNDAAKEPDSPFAGGRNGYGFGLLNCKGIIEKYRKLSSIFRVCEIGVESAVGQGSRFFFRLPKGVLRLFIGLLMVLSFSVSSMGEPAAGPRSEHEELAHTMKGDVCRYADSLYACNLKGHYAQAMLFADSALWALNHEYLSIRPHGKDLMEAVGDKAAVPAEVKWFLDSLPMPYDIILEVRNERAVACLALHEWDGYRYNNRVYTQLFKVCSADQTLDHYCETMQRSAANKRVAMALLLLFLFSLFPAYYLLYYRHQVYYRFCLHEVSGMNEMLLSDAPDEAKLRFISAVKTGRFPLPLQSVVSQIRGALRESVAADEDQLTSIELAEDELHRTQYENDKLHVTNAVLDNCLSTLKHETMYYPSRIRSLVEEGDGSLESMMELANYYKELYTLLSAQAMRQLDAVKPGAAPTRLPLDMFQEIKAGEANPTSENNIEVLADNDMLRYLFTLLRKQNAGKPLEVRVGSEDSGYWCVTVALPYLHLSQNQVSNLFTPSVEGIAWLLIRQIVRDTGEATHARRCGISAVQAADGSTLLTLVLPRT